MVVLSAALTACGDHSSKDAATTLPHATASAGPQEFVRRWVAAETRMQHTGRTAPYLDLSTGCQNCHALAHAIARYYADGGYLQGGDWKIHSIKVTPSSGGDLVSVGVEATPMTIKTSSSDRGHFFKRERTTLFLRVGRRSGSYVVTSRTQD